MGCHDGGHICLNVVRAILPHHRYCDIVAIWNDFGAANDVDRKSKILNIPLRSEGEYFVGGVDGGSEKEMRVGSQLAT